MDFQAVLDKFLTKVFGSKQDRDVKRYQPLVDLVNTFEPKMQTHSDEDLAALTPSFKERIEEGESLESILPEAFAAVREAAKRVTGMRHFDVQIMGGIALYEGKIAEMATGEGKTLVATLPAYLIALEGKGVHIVTVNDFLAKRDMEWMGPIHQFLGLTVGAIQHDQPMEEKSGSYQADITYGTNNEFGFDYLRSNLTVALEDRPQRGLHYAIVDEVDSILIDEARTPLIISGPAEMSPELYYRVNSIIPRLQKGEDFKVDEKDRNVLMTEEGIESAQRLLGLENMFTEENLEIVHHLDQGLRAHHLFQKDVHYVVQDGEVIIVDEFTGRLMSGRRWSDGLHQAVEAKEGVKIERENQTLATITFQNYFRMYDKLAGMTGTADTEAAEFREIYNLDVVVVPQNRALARRDDPDQVYRSEKEKFESIVATLVDCNQRKQPVLVGTVSIEKSEHLADLLKNRGYWRKRIKEWAEKIQEELADSKLSENQKMTIQSQLSSKEGMTVEEADGWGDECEQNGSDRLGHFFRRVAETTEVFETVNGNIPFNVLNAKFHERESAIVAQAGSPGAITIATNMAGRGTDIVLGGNPDKMVEDELSRLPKEASDEDRKKKEEQIRSECKAGRDTVVDAGGLMIVGTERHESRRIDNQLRGRSGRQGDPGSSQFFLSLEDDLMRLFGGERIQNIATRFGMAEGEVIQAKLVSRSIRKAQKRVEDRNFEIRKYVIKYDDVMNKQREVIYGLRNELLEGNDPEETFQTMAWDVFDDTAQGFFDRKVAPEDWDLDSFNGNLFQVFNLKVDVSLPQGGDIESAIEETERIIWKQIEDWYEERKSKAPSIEEWRHLMQYIMLVTVDHKWKDHLLTMDHLKDSIGLRGYAGKDPQQEYAREGFEQFEQMYASLGREVVSRMFHVEMVESKSDSPQNRRMRRSLPSPQRVGGVGPITTRKRSRPKIGRNDPCHCGSGKKYKKCCMKDAA